jgi:peptidoglycan/xylan/chitin deacetylase (PgdA/CDA1 family)
MTAGRFGAPPSYTARRGFETESMNFEHGVFTLSLDFELYWGVRDKRSIDAYGVNLRGVRQAIPAMLRMFEHDRIHVTWAVVGFLFFRDAAELKSHVPALLPTYANQRLSPYRYIDNTADLDALYHFAPELIHLIAAQEGQEIASHTFSHYCCLEEGQDLAQFDADIAAAVEIANCRGMRLKSLVFPRNQWNEDYLSTLRKYGFECFRGNGVSRLYRASDGAGQSRLLRAMRLVDAYVNLSGHNTYDLQSCIRQTPYNFPASSFLRPFSERLAFLDGLRLKRIKQSMTDAALNKRLYHLWWHPHNFGRDTEENIAFLQAIVDHFKVLKNRYGFESMNMGELCDLAAAYSAPQATRLARAPNEAEPVPHP